MVRSAARRGEHVKVWESGRKRGEDVMVRWRVVEKVESEKEAVQAGE